MRAVGIEQIDEDAIAEVGTWMSEASRIVVFTGAGISTDSGIPDYRGPNGVWTQNPKAEKMSNISHYLNDPEVRELAWQSRVGSSNYGALPNDGHRALVAMQSAGRLHALVTQNIDELHQISGIDPDKVVEVHGTMRWSRCWTCADRLPMQETLERVRAGDPDPSCLLCGGILKSDTISFGQALIPEVMERALTVAEECDVLLAIGSTLTVGPANQVVPRAKANGARVVIVNGDVTAMDKYAHALLQGGITPILQALVARAGFLT
jgi:NAD-dependent deacetylase